MSVPRFVFASPSIEPVVNRLRNSRPSRRQYAYVPQVSSATREAQQKTREKVPRVVTRDNKGDKVAAAFLQHLIPRNYPCHP